LKEKAIIKMPSEDIFLEKQWKFTELTVIIKLQNIKYRKLK